MKLVLRLALLALLLLGLLLLGGYLFIPSAAKKAVENGSRYAFGVPTVLDDLGARLRPSTSGLNLGGYRVASPTGFGDTPLLSVRELEVDVGTRSLFGEPKVLDELVLDGLELHLVQRGLTENNLLPVLQQVRKLTGGPSEAGAGAGAGDGESNPGPRITVRSVRITGLAASLEVTGIPGLGDISERFELPAYVADWSAKTGGDGVTLAEFAGLLLEAVSDSAVAAADGKLPPVAVQALRATLDGGLAGGLGGALDAASRQARQLVDDQVQGLTDRASGELEALTGQGAAELDKVKDATAGELEKLQEKAGGELEKVQEKAGAEVNKALEGVLGGKAKGLLGGGG